ncbi:MAG TPA: hypothetical protein VH497_00565 [Vicinamibacterales bacterium]|jgi:hypothetical protein
MGATGRGLLCALALALGVTPAAQAQNVETDPIQCWWRTSAGAIRAGETFTVVLTCAVIETPDVKVVVDESRLEPSVVQFAPFEVTGGQHAADLRNGDRRFFQYEYRLRLIAENLFGKDVQLPETKLSYRVQSRLAARQPSGQGRDESIAGRDQTYILPPVSLKLLSLVPADASDIRDAGTETFGDVDRRTFRASLLTVIGGVLFALAALVAVLSIVRAIMRTRKPISASDRLVGDGAILRGVGRELAAVQRRREDGGWTPDLAARALAALRVVGTYAMGRRAARAEVVNISANGSGEAMSDGRIFVKVGWPRTKNVAISGAATARSIAGAIARTTNGRRPGELESMEEALSRFTIAQYSRPTAEGKATVDEGALDESMRAGQDILKRLKIEHTWLMRKLKRNRRAVQAETRVWSH